MEDQIESMAERDRLLVGLAELGKTRLLVAYERQVLGLGQIRLAYLRLAQVLLGIFYFPLQFLRLCHV